jgi:hypothetical protein
VKLRLPRGRWNLSLQYDSQVSLTVTAGGHNFTLPPSLDGMYLSEQGEASFWHAGSLRSTGGHVKVTVAASEPSSFQRFVGVRRQVWLGGIAATAGGPQTAPLHDACKRYVDHYVVGAKAPVGQAAASSG